MQRFCGYRDWTGVLFFSGVRWSACTDCTGIWWSSSVSVASSPPQVSSLDSGVPLKHVCAFFEKKKENKKRELMRGLVRVCRGLHAILSFHTASSSVNGTLAMICAMGSYRIKSRQPSLIVARQVLLWWPTNTCNAPTHAENKTQSEKVYLTPSTIS
jgi:hypothetical protein